MDIMDVCRFAEEQGFGGIRPLGTRDRFTVYEALTEDLIPRCQYLPDLILIEGDRIRMATDAEAATFMVADANDT